MMGHRRIVHRKLPMNMSGDTRGSVVQLSLIHISDGTGMFLAPFSDGEAFTDAMYDFSIFLTFLSENEEINFYVGAQPLRESRDLPD